MILLILLSLFLNPAQPQAGSVAEPLKVAFFGDQGIKGSSESVLQLVKTEKAELIVHLGDFDYKDDPKAWDNMITRILGKNFPMIAALGNHDTDKQSKYQEKLNNRLSRMPEAACQGETGIQASCTFRGLHIVTVTPQLNGLDHAAYAKQALAQSASPWRICAWHIPRQEMQVEQANSQTTWNLYEACREGGALIATGHSHTYSRTHLMENFQDQKIASKENRLEIEKGKTIAFVSGVGGYSVRKRLGKRPWWAVSKGVQDGLSYGALFCTFHEGGRADRASCYFKDTNGREWDRFQLVNFIR